MRKHTKKITFRIRKTPNWVQRKFLLFTSLSMESLLCALSFIYFFVSLWCEHIVFYVDDIINFIKCDWLSVELIFYYLSVWNICFNCVMWHSLCLNYKFECYRKSANFFLAPPFPFEIMVDEKSVKMWNFCSWIFFHLFYKA